MSKKYMLNSAQFTGLYIFLIRDPANISALHLAFTAVTLNIGSIVYTLDFRVMTKKESSLILKIVYKKNELYMFLECQPMKYLVGFFFVI